MSLSQTLKLLLTQEANWRRQTINLNASENYTSPLVKQLIGLHPSYDFYTFPPSGGSIDGPWYFTQPPYLQKIEAHINQLGKILLDCNILDPRPKGGQASEIAVLTGLAKAGDKVLYVQEQDGGHFGLNFISQKIGIQLIPIPFDGENYQIDVEKTQQLILKIWKKETPRKIILIGQSFVLRQQPLDKLVEKAKNQFPDLIVAYDVSHILGLIIGKQFTNPISQGVDFIHGSTHKTFPGPQKGILGFPVHFDNNLRLTIQQALAPGLQSNCGTSEILGLAVALEEMQIHGIAYASAVCQHAQYLAQLLDKAGFHIAGKHFGFTETHQVWIIISTEQRAWQAFSQLHRIGIRVYPAYLPFVKAWGLRLSTNAITRLGFSKSEICTLAQWITDVLLNNCMPEKIFRQVKLLMKKFPLYTVKYALHDEDVHSIFRVNHQEFFE